MTRRVSPQVLGGVGMCICGLLYCQAAAEKAHQ
jgi:hypothetical protein